jgi:hypothetical protein
MWRPYLTLVRHFRWDSCVGSLGWDPGSSAACTVLRLDGGSTLCGAAPDGSGPSAFERPSRGPAIVQPLDG